MDEKKFIVETSAHHIHVTKETLEKYGFTPSHSPYYIVLHFDSKNVTSIGSQKHLKEGTNTFRAKIRRLSDFLGIN